MLNLQQLVAACNTRHWQLQGGGGAAAGGKQQQEEKGAVYDGVVCRVHTFGRDLLLDVAVVQSTDVFVTLHGAGEVNALFLRPGSSLVELRPYELGTKYKWVLLILCFSASMASWHVGACIQLSSSG